MNEVRVKFLKTRFYRGKQYNIGDIIFMMSNDLKAYIENNVVKVIGTDKTKKMQKKIIDYSKLPYKKIQQICRNKKIPAVGKRNELISSLNELDKG